MSRSSHKRTSYSYFDLLGDIGGLFASFKLIGFFILSVISLIQGSQINRFIMETIFMKDGFHVSSRKDLNTDHEQEKMAKAVKVISMKQPIRFGRCSLACCLNRSEMKLQKRGYKRVQRELDLVRFIRNQKLFEIAFQTLFTKFQ